MISHDQLTQNERVRLEALARTQGMSSITPSNWQEIKNQAEQVEKWLKEADLGKN